MLRMEEEETILDYGNYTNYYVQSPSTVSHANSTITETDMLYRTNNPQLLLLPKPQMNLDNAHGGGAGGRASSIAFTNDLSRCSSSRASTTSFLHENKVAVVSVGDHAFNVMNNSSATNNKVLVPNNIALKNKKLGKVFYEDFDEDEGSNYDKDGGHCWRYFSFDTYSSPVWIALQLLWRFLLSIMVALLVFYLVTKPPPPRVALKVTRVSQFELPEGLDLTGVATNFLSCNISMGLIIDNKSKVFGLHILSPKVDIYFGRVPLVLSQGPKMYVRSREWKEMKLYTGTKKKAIYGAGRNMEEMLNSGHGLPLIITLTFNSFYRVVPNLIQSDFHHHAHCVLFLQNLYDQKHRTQVYNTTCLNSS